MLLGMSIALLFPVAASNAADVRHLKLGDIETVLLVQNIQSTNDLSDTSDVSDEEHVTASQFSLTQDLSGYKLHLNHYEADEEQFNQLGMSWNSTTLYGFSGYAKGSYLGDNRYTSIDPFLFHGGSHQQIRFKGVAFVRALGEGLLHVSHARVAEDSRLPRSAWEVGYEHKNWSFALLQTKRDLNESGKGITLGYQGKNVSVDFQHLSSYANVKVNQLRLGFTQNNISYGLLLSSQNNPYYADKEENRLVLSAGFVFGAGPMQASEDKKLREKIKNNKGITIGTSVVAAAALMSMGGGGKSGTVNADILQRNSAQHDAAREVLNSINPTSVREYIEYGGYVYRNPDGSYSSTRPVSGMANSLNLSKAYGRLPGNSQQTAHYHTHGGADLGYMDEEFSPTDLRADRKFNLDGYLGTPSGAFKYHDVGTDSVSVIGSIAN